MHAFETNCAPMSHQSHKSQNINHDYDPANTKIPTSTKNLIRDEFQGDDNDSGNNSIDSITQEICNIPTSSTHSDTIHDDEYGTKSKHNDDVSLESDFSRPKSATSHHNNSARLGIQSRQVECQDTFIPNANSSILTYMPFGRIVPFDKIDQSAIYGDADSVGTNNSFGTHTSLDTRDTFRSLSSPQAKSTPNINGNNEIKVTPKFERQPPSHHQLQLIMTMTPAGGELFFRQ